VSEASVCVLEIAYPLGYNLSAVILEELVEEINLTTGLKDEGLCLQINI